MYRLLIVDDEPMTREYIKSHVSGLHAQWVCAGEAGDGQEALELIAAQSEPFDLIVMDIKMPVMSGLELARELAGRRSRPRMVILSGYDEFSLAKEAMRYGVFDYMLKPLVKEELVSVLDKMARQLAAEHAEQIAYQSLLALSEQSRQQIARNFLRAVVSDNNTEIKVLYPLLHRLKISLLEGEGIILLLDLDEGQLLERGISPGDLALFRYIVHQAASELTSSAAGIVLFVDNEQRTALLVTGDDAADAQRRCQEQFAALSQAIQDMTGLGLWGASGSSEIDVLQLGVSYRKADEALKQRLFMGESDYTLLLGEALDPIADSCMKQLEDCIAAVRYMGGDSHDPQLRSALQSLMKAIGTLDRRGTLRLGLYLLQALAPGWTGAAQQDKQLQAAQLLEQEAAEQRYAPEAAAQLYTKMLAPLLLSKRPDIAAKDGSDDEHAIVKQVKAYIHAHFAEPLSLALIADKMGVSPGYLSSLFHQNTEESYIKFLTRVRMQRAAQLLRARPAEKVYDVAEKVGYLSVKHFSHVFKQFYGIPPGEYQERG